MTISIRTNVNALYTQASLRSTESKMATSMERLSTGLRVNTSKDDAAGLAIGQSMSTKIINLNQGIRNINDGINLIQTAEGGLDSINQMLQRVRELSVQAANGTYSEEQRSYLNLEAKQLQVAINQVIDSTCWNEQNLLGEGFNKSLKLGAGENDEFMVEIPKLSAFYTSFNTYQSSVKGMLTTAVNVNIGDLTINDVKISLNPSLSASNLASSINIQSTFTGVTAIARETVSLTSRISEMPKSINSTNLSNNKEIFVNPLSGHSYQFIKNINPISWLDAKVAAENKILNGEPGYLVTVTTKQESDFIQEKFGTSFSAWIGASDANQEEVWKWVTGPEAGTTFYTGKFPDGVSLGFTNWLASQPIDFNGSEDYAAYWDILGTNGWNDFLNSGENWVSNYIVEHSLNNSIPDNAIQINGVNIGQIPNALTSAERIDQMISAVNAKSLMTGVGAVADYINGGIKLNAVDGRNIEISTLANLNINGSNTGIELNGLPVGDRLITKFSSGVDLFSKSSKGIEIKTTGNISAKTGLISQNVQAEITSTTKVNKLIDISRVETATNALEIIDQGVDHISKIRARLGSYMNTLTHASDSLTNISTNLTASRSQILDADYSRETTNLASSQIIQQAATAVLAQANISQKSVLDLLKEI